MMPSLNQLLAMVGRSIRSPREGAEEVLALGVPKEALWTIVALVVVLSVILAQFTALLAGAMGADAGMGGVLASPAVAGSVQLALLLLMIFAVHYVGRGMGGTGSLEESMLLMSWLQFVLVVLQVLQTLALLVLPPLAGLIGLVALGLFFWLLTNFVAVIHGFKSLSQVFVMIFVTGFTIAFILSVLLALFGVTIPQPTVGT